MKLGEALTQRARQAQKLNDLQERIKAAVLVQEGDDSQEDANALIAEYVQVSNEHASLVSRIALANVENGDGEGTLLELIHLREALTRERNIYRSAATAANPSKNTLFRYSRSEVKFVSSVDVPALRVKEAEIEQKISALDARIQKLNWNTEL